MLVSVGEIENSSRNEDMGFRWVGRRVPTTAVWPESRSIWDLNKGKNLQKRLETTRAEQVAATRAAAKIRC